MCFRSRAIPANSRFNVTTTATWDMTLNVMGTPLTNCGDATGTGRVCLGGSDAFSGPESVSLVNASANPLTVFIVLDGYTAQDSGAFDLTTTTTAIPPAAYTKTAVPQAWAPL